MRDKMDVLIFGSTGQVGIELMRQVWPADVVLFAPGRREIDVSNETALGEVVASRPWRCVINSAAYTAVDLAETQVATAWKINALAPAVLAAATAKAGIPLIHLSTDYVFDGDSPEAYEPDDPIRPRSVYGASKAGGEHAVRSSNPNHVIIRTSWVFSPHGSNFVKTMLRLAGERDELRVVDDQRGSPTSAADLAAIVSGICQRLLAEPKGPFGTYHFANAGVTTWCQFAREIMAGAARRGAPAVPVKAIATRDFRTAAVRPANSALSTETLRRDYAVTPRPWQHALEDVLEVLCTPKRSGEDK